MYVYTCVCMSMRGPIESKYMSILVVYTFL